ncbi:hypothetical protein ElyMa_006754900 [Elysia marginata]|uniref:Uncharacterized protein n=1 Tax=Elysia marginata TaxID=1093978 RepID=A0AAV4J0L2_9GAST|nr:hypothetical protein ElyMa_006754900 [Elysia marginata]
MPTEIRIVLPDMGIDDSISTITDADNFDGNCNYQTNGNIANKVIQGSNDSFVKCTNAHHAANGFQSLNDTNQRNSKTVGYNNKNSSFESFPNVSIGPKNVKIYSQQNGHDNAAERNNSSENQQSSYSSSSRVVLHQTQHQLLDIDFQPGQGPSPVVLDKDRSSYQSSHKTPSPAVHEASNTSEATKATQARGDAKMNKSVRPSLTETYGEWWTLLLFCI